MVRISLHVPIPQLFQTVGIELTIAYRCHEGSAGYAGAIRPVRYSLLKDNELVARYKVFRGVTC
jgi:hypothetical protein